MSKRIQNELVGDTSKPSLLFTPSGVRLRRRVQGPGSFNWLLLPGGPGIGSESLFELADALDVPGTIWMVDLPGDGSNIDLPEPAGGYYRAWPQVLIEAAQALPNCVYVGHSTGGMYLLSVPELETHLKGLVLIGSAPDARWHARFVTMAGENPLPAVNAASERFEADKSAENFRAIAVAAADWSFTPDGLTAGRQLLARMPYNQAAVEWSEHNFDHTYAAAWWPQSLPTLILSGAEDRIVAQDLWGDPRFQGENIMRTIVEDAGHFLWLEKPDQVRAAFSALVTRLQATDQG